MAIRDFYKALVVRESAKGLFTRSIESLETKNLINSCNDEELIIDVKYSSLNYKDALSSIGNKGVTKAYPHSPGIDAAGIVVYSKSKNVVEGLDVLVTGFDLGMNTWGGFSSLIKVPASWIIKRPKSLSLKECMIIGTAGFTAGLGLINLIERAHLKPTDGPILVTGSSGGVGSMAVYLLKSIGYEVHALSLKAHAHDYLKNLGAQKILTGADFDLLREQDKGLLKGLWAGVFDSVGGDVLGTALKCIRLEGAATTCGNVAGLDFNASIFPFIIRGIDLFGINSAETPRSLREQVWNKLSSEWRVDLSQKLLVHEATLDELNDQWIDKILKSQVMGRVLVIH